MEAPFILHMLSPLKHVSPFDVKMALDAGFTRAYATIIDSHLTALIAAIALFWVGSGPIRGFAITLSIGIVSTLFTAYLVTRLIVAYWVKWARPKEVPL